MKDKEIVFICAAYTKGASVIVNSPMDLVTPNIIMNSNILENCYKFGVKKVIPFLLLYFPLTIKANISFL